MANQKIAWIANSLGEIDAFVDVMEERGFRIAYHSHAIPAIEDLTKGEKYSLVVINPDIAPGVTSTDPVIERAMKLRVGGHPAYWDVALRVVELTHGGGSVNRDTPIIVAGTYHPITSVLWPHARAICLEVGAVDYIHLSAPHFDFESFYGKLEKLARGN